MTAVLSPAELDEVTRKRHERVLEPMSPEVLQRFTAKIRVSENGCWEWTAALNRGYGVFVVRHGYIVAAHRISYRHFVGPIPEGLDLDHLCRNPGCVNPQHLEPVTARENLVRGTGWSGRNARKTHCKNGHEFTPENTYITPKKYGRICRTCRTEAKRQSEAAIRRQVAGSSGQKQYRRLSDSQRSDLRRQHTEGVSMRSLAVTFGVCTKTVGLIIREES